MFCLPSLFIRIALIALTLQSFVVMVADVRPTDHAFWNGGIGDHAAKAAVQLQGGQIGKGAGHGVEEGLVLVGAGLHALIASFIAAAKDPIASKRS